MFLGKGFPSVADEPTRAGRIGGSFLSGCANRLTGTVLLYRYSSTVIFNSFPGMLERHKPVDHFRLAALAPNRGCADEIDSSLLKNC